MFHLITGGSGSGKSLYAEEQTLWMSKQNEKQKAGNPCIYIATMKPYGEETLKKIERHRQLRAGKGFLTAECYGRLDRICLPENSGILLECMSNLAANELYGKTVPCMTGRRQRSRFLRSKEYFKTDGSSCDCDE